MAWLLLASRRASSSSSSSSSSLLSSSSSSSSLLSSSSSSSSWSSSSSSSSSLCLLSGDRCLGRRAPRRAPSVRWLSSSSSSSSSCGAAAAAGNDESYVLVYDLGTTNVKSLVYSSRGELVAHASRETDVTVVDAASGAVEQSASAWWSHVVATSQQALSSLPPRVRRAIVAVSVTNQRETVVPVDAANSPMRGAMLWYDTRASAQCAALAPRAEDIYTRTGLTVNPYFSLPKLRWIADNEPDVFARAHRFVLVHDFVLHALRTAGLPHAAAAAVDYVTDESNASRTMLYNLHTRAWDDELCTTSGVRRERLPRIVASGTAVGELSPGAEQLLGFGDRRASSSSSSSPLPPVRVVVGGGDQQCAALGVGAVRPGQVKLTTGTGAFLLAAADAPVLDDPRRRRLLCSAHVVPGSFVLEASIFNAGSALRWFRDICCADVVDAHASSPGAVYPLISDWAGSVAPGSDGLVLLPYFSGAGAPHWRADARATWSGLTLAHSRAHMARSIFEGVACEVRANLEVMSSLLGARTIASLRITGGAAQSDVWNQIYADVCRVSVERTAVAENTSLGAAMLACVGAGVHASIDDAVDAMVALRHSTAPRVGDDNDDARALAALYDAMYHKSRRLVAALDGEL